MRKIYISFIGLGSLNSNGLYSYNPTKYHIDGKEASERYGFVQLAEMDLIGGDYFDRVFLIVTPEAKDHHFDNIVRQMKELKVRDVVALDIENKLDASSQWALFEKILAVIDKGDELTIDLTHGYRIAPIVISTAINFLQKSKKISLKHVWYGAYEHKQDLTPIIDIKDFYVINEWAEAVSRLVEDADAKAIGEISRKTPGFQIGNLANPITIKALEELTEAVRNIEIQNIAEKASKAITLIKQSTSTATETGRILLDLAYEKFVALVSGGPNSGKYDLCYFNTQLEVIRILLEHKLFMQAYTVMIEFVGSIGIIKAVREPDRTYNNSGRKLRYKADLFKCMLQHVEEKWHFQDSDHTAVNELNPWYETLKKLCVIDELRSFYSELVDFRNGFAHAWTRKALADPDIEVKAKEFYAKLKHVKELLVKNKIWDS